MILTHTQTQIDQVESVQRRTTHWIKSDYSRTSSVTEMLNSLHLRRLDVRRIDAGLSLFSKIHHNLVDIPINEYVTQMTRPALHSRTLSYRSILQPWITSSSFTSQEQFIIGIHFSLSLPTSLPSSSSFQQLVALNMCHLSSL